MKKILMFLLLGIFMISFASAFEFDNTYDYNSGTKTAVINNCDFWLVACLNEGEVLAEVILTSGDTTVPRGIDVLVGEFNFTTTGDFEDVFGEMYLKDMKNGNEISRGKQYKYKKYTNRNVDDYQTVCNDVWNTTNGNYTSECTQEEIGSHVELQMDWIPIINPTNIFYSGVTYEIGIFVDVEAQDYGDWRPSILGVDISEWATWKEDLNSGLTYAFRFDDNLATTNVLDANNTLNLTSFTNTNNIYNASGQIDSAFNFNGVDDRVILPSQLTNVDNALSVSMWINPNAINGNGLFSDVSTVGFSFYESNTGSLHFRYNGQRWLTDTGPITAEGGWFHIVVRKASGASTAPTAYINNVSIAISAISNGANVNDLSIGRIVGTIDMNGQIDEVLVYDRVITASEVSEIYDAGLSGNGFTKVFGTSPSVVLTSPANNSNLTSASVDFITTVTDDQQVVNVSLILDDSIVQTNTSGVNGSYTFTETVSEGDHNWSILAYNNQSISNQSETRVFNYTQPPINIQLIEPTDAFVSNIALVNMSCNASDSLGVEQLNLTINGIVEETLVNSTTAENLTLSKEINFSEGIYIWGCQAINSMSEADSANRTLNVTYSLPVVTLISPDDDSNTTNQNVTFSATATDTNGISNVTLYIDGIVNQTNTSGVNGNYSFSTALPEDIYNWSISATSILGKQTNSSNRSLIVHLTAPNATISAPTGNIDYFLLGQNETLSYSFTEPGQNLSEHLEECWYGYPISDIDCYQESANTSNQTGIDGDCGLNYSGEYFFKGVPHDLEKLIDGNWSTGASGSVDMHINYTKPTGMTDAVWNIKAGQLITNQGHGVNISIPESCFNYDSEKIILLANLTGTTGPGVIFSCYNGTWKTLYAPNFNNIYEEAILWTEKIDLNCTANEANFTYINGADSITIFARDTFGFVASATSTWNYTLLEINQTFINETTEGNTQNISALITLLAGETISAAILDYGGELFAGESSLSGGNTIILKSDLVTPNVDGDENVTFHWSIVLSGGEIINLSEQTQSVLSIGIDNCSSFTNKILNITMVDEEMQTPLSNTTIEIALNFLSSDRSVTIISFSQQFDNENPISICIDQNITQGIQYSLDAIIRYTASGYANEYYNIVDTALTNETGTINLTLYSLNESDSTEFQLTFTGEDYLPVEDALVSVGRQYISEDVFKTVELPKTDANGQTVLHLVRNDVIYNIVVMKNNVILGNFENVIAFCDDFTIGDCTLPLNAISNISQVFEYDDEIGIIFDEAPRYNETTRVTSFSFISTDGTTKIVNMVIERRDIFGNRTVCENTVISSSGTVSCQVSQDIEDTSLISLIYVNGEQQLTSTVIIDSTAYGPDGYAMLFIFGLATLLMFSGSKTWTLVGVSLNYVFGVSLGLMIGGILGVGATGIAVITISVVGIWQLNKGRKQ